MKSIKLLLLFFFLVFGVYVSFAQDKREHVIAKGETISSIAGKYNVTEAALISENPVLKNYIYVGMKIRIPGENKHLNDLEQPQTQADIQDSKEATGNQQSASLSVEENTPVQTVEVSRVSEPASSSETTQVSRWGFADKAGYYFVPQKGQSGFMLQFSAGADYSIAKFFFVEGLIGYGYNYYYSNMDYGFGKTKMESTSHYITASQDANVIFPIGNLFGVGLFTGPEEYFFLTGSTVIDKEKTKIKPENRFSFSYDVGAKFYVGTFTFGAEYKIALNKYGSSYLGFFIGYTFG